MISRKAPFKVDSNLKGWIFTYKREPNQVHGMRILFLDTQAAPAPILWKTERANKQSEMGILL